MLSQISNFKAVSYPVKQNGQNRLGFSFEGLGPVSILLREKEDLEVKITQLELRNTVLAEENQEFQAANSALKERLANVEAENTKLRRDKAVLDELKKLNAQGKIKLCLAQELLGNT